MTDSSVSLLIEKAMRQGFAIIPVGPDKRPVIPTWKEFQLTRPSHAQVELWEREHPAPGAIITGPVDGVVVLDFDGDPGNAISKRRSRRERREFLRQIWQGGRHAE